MSEKKQIEIGRNLGLVGLLALLALAAIGTGDGGVMLMSIPVLFIYLLLT